MDLDENDFYSLTFERGTTLWGASYTWLLLLSVVVFCYVGASLLYVKRALASTPQIAQCLIEFETSDVILPSVKESIIELTALTPLPSNGARVAVTLQSGEEWVELAASEIELSRQIQGGQTFLRIHHRPLNRRSFTVTLAPLEDSIAFASAQPETIQIFLDPAPQIVETTPEKFEPPHIPEPVVPKSKIRVSVAEDSHSKKTVTLTLDAGDLPAGKTIDVAIEHDASTFLRPTGSQNVKFTAQKSRSQQLVFDVQTRPFGRAAQIDFVVSAEADFEVIYPKSLRMQLAPLKVHEQQSILLVVIDMNSPFQEEARTKKWHAKMDSIQDQIETVLPQVKDRLLNGGPFLLRSDQGLVRAVSSDRWGRGEGFECDNFGEPFSLLAEILNQQGDSVEVVVLWMSPIEPLQKAEVAPMSDRQMEVVWLDAPESGDFSHLTAWLPEQGGFRKISSAVVNDAVLYFVNKHE